MTIEKGPMLAVYFLARELMDPPETHVDDGTYVSGRS
jgi:hypothetical protein